MGNKQDAGPMGGNPMALLGQEGAQKDYYYYYYFKQRSHLHLQMRHGLAV
jgi:hypothetical protein